MKKMYTLNENEARALAAEIKKQNNRDDAYAMIDEFAKDKGVFIDGKEGCMVLDFSAGDHVFNAMQRV